MRWYLLAAVSIGLSISDSASFAQGPAGGERLSASRSSLQDAGYFATTGVVRFQLIQGRIGLDPPRHRKGSQSRDEAGVYESITVTATRGIPSLHYVYQSPKHHLTLDVKDAVDVRVESYFPVSGERAVLIQPERGLADWTVSRGDLNDQYEGPTLLHLRNQSAGVFDLHFACLFERMLRGQTLQQLTEHTVQAMLSTAETCEFTTAADVQLLVEQLGAKNRSQRMVAQRKLIQLGTPILPLVDSVPSDRLDAEQRDRLKEIRKRLRSFESDSPASLALLLINDREFWRQAGDGMSDGQLVLVNRHLQNTGLVALQRDQQPDRRIASGRD